MMINVNPCIHREIVVMHPAQILSTRIKTERQALYI